MALIKCKECGKEISNKANSCPKCGCPVKESKSNHKKEYKDLTTVEKKKLEMEMAKKGLWFDGVMVALLIAFGLSMWFNYYFIAVVLFGLTILHENNKKRKYYYQHKEYEESEK